jgi:ribosome biogenesis GTPase
MYLFSGALKNLECHGRVVEEQKNYFLVDTDQGIIRCVLKGTLKKVRTRVCAGDLVTTTITNNNPPEGIINNLEDRTSYIKRPALANLTQIVLVATWKSPQLDLESIDRMLFSAEVYGIRPLLVFNKVDLLTDEESVELDALITLYQRCGYTALKTSAETLTGIDQLKKLCEREISAFSGLSGVGKSTLLSKIFPDIHFRIGEVSGIKGRGTHTTTNIIIHRYNENSYIADTPGLSFVDIPEISEDTVGAYFPEIAACIGTCRFNNCFHDNEPGCEVLNRISKGEIAESRRKHYLKIFGEMKAIRKQYRK